MLNKKQYASTGLIGLCCYLLCFLFVLAYEKFHQVEQGILYWICLYVVALFHIIIVAAFLRLFKLSNWSKGKWIIIDAVFFALTVLYLLFWLFVWMIADAFTFNYVY